MRIRKVIISYIRLDHTLYSINYGIWLKKWVAKPSQGGFLPFFCLELKIIRGLRSWPHSLSCVCVCMRLLFEDGCYFFRRAPCASTILGWLLIGVRLLFKYIWYAQSAKVVLILHAFVLVLWMNLIPFFINIIAFQPPFYMIVYA